ncbi:phage tail protein X [Brevundimonas bullata]|uniref:Phage tail protein X n=1 Tax=Brevundimonas bullata TaxID=13160 RepID=A0A7W7INH6_9CAUL|nr:tail protein X [Brevundimonas bullata]MBB4797594.1 phage tail protein X [Brevundimonas bullata]MBB6382554.1 phage tail protein X [Brevundimonas bullata]
MARGNDMMPVEAVQGETLDQLVWRVLRQGAPAVERVLEANPGLADAGLFLTRGQQVLVPAGARSAAPVPMTQLWT